MSRTVASRTRAQLIEELVRRRVARLQESMLGNDHTQAAAQAQLARLRGCRADEVGLNPLVWELTLGDLPEELDARGDLPSPVERAIHAAMVLYANHQQSQREPMHVTGGGLGTSVQRLARARATEGEEFDLSVIKKFHQVGLATEWEARIHHLRGLIVLLRGEAIPLDYGKLAVDLWRLADSWQDPASVLTQWGRGLHARPKSEESGEEK